MAQRMLVIDDEELVLTSCRKVFEAEGFEVVTTTSPQEGLGLASASSFDIILCDWKMPGFDGMDVIEEINQRSPGSPIVMISGYPTIGRANEAMKRGAMDYVPKPFTPDEIVDAVRRAMGRRSRQTT
jgi:DNA-binding NtrC family response regulator